MALTDFMSELKRRRVFRVAAAYAAVAFVIAQAADIFLPGLGMPGWALRAVLAVLVLGFPVALVLAWVFDLTPEGVRRTERAPPSTGPNAAAPAAGLPVLPIRTAAAIGAGTVAVLVGVGAYVGTRPAAPAESGEVSAAVVAVLPFSVRGSSEFAYLGEGMVTLLATKLDGAGQLRSVDPRAILGVAEQVGTNGLLAERAPTIAMRAGAGMYVLGDVVEVQRRLHIEAALYDPAQGREPLARASVEGNADDLFDLVDALTARLIAGITRGPAERLTQIALHTTPSLPALKAYLEGESLRRVSSYAAAVEAFQRAVAEDTAFALAYFRMGLAAEWGNLGGQRRAYEQAVRHSARLASRDRTLVAANLAFWDGDAAAAERQIRALLERHPDDVDAWVLLGEILFHYNPLRGYSIAPAAEPWQRVLVYEPDNLDAIVHLARLYAATYQHGELQALAQRVAALDYSDSRVLQIRGLHALATADTAEWARLMPFYQRLSSGGLELTVIYLAGFSRSLTAARPLAALLLDAGRPATSHFVGATSLASIDLATGRWRSAREQLSAAAPHDAPDQLTLLALHVLYSVQPFIPVDTSELRETRSNVARQEAGPGRSYLLSLLDARLGDHRSAERHLAALERSASIVQEDSNLVEEALHGLRAYIAWTQGRPRVALAALARIREDGVPYASGLRDVFVSRSHVRYLRGEVLLQLDRPEEALRWFESLGQYSYSDVVFLAPAELRQAEIHERLGRHEQAALHYSRFVELWKDADPELQPTVEAARRRLVALRGPH